MSPTPEPRARVDWLAVLIIVVAVAFRAWRIDAPFVDAHSWRQVANVDIARNWAEGPIDFFYPKVSWGGPDGRVGFEFPLLFLLIGLVWRVVGVVDVAGRLVPVGFSVATVWLTYRLGTRLLGAPVGRAAALLMAVSPSVVYFGRTPISDTPMLAFSVAAVLSYVAYAQTGRSRFALAGAVWLALAGLVKLPAILVLGPIAVIAALHRGWVRWLDDPWYVAGPLASIGAVGLWYLHADQIFLETGLTAAIFRPSGTYPSEIAQWAGVFRSVSHWTRPEHLTWDVAAALSDRFLNLHLTPAFALIALIGFLLPRWPLRGRLVIDVWMLAAASLILVSLGGQMAHEFHQLPALPPLALYFGMGAAPLFDPATYRRFVPRWRGWAIALTSLLLLAVAVRGFLGSGAIPLLYRPNAMNTSLIDAGRAIDARTPAEALLVTVEYERYGTNSPMLLYFAHRKGWSFDATSISPGVIAYLQSRRGACYLAVTDWSTLEAARPDVIDFLKPYPHIDLPYTDSSYQLVDLGCGAAGAPAGGPPPQAMLDRR